MKSNNLLLFVLILTVCLTQFASDIYAPSLPDIALKLHTKINYVQWSMSVFMLGVAITHLIYGPISEGIGRKIPIIIGISIMIIGGLVCLLAINIEILIFGRFIQGCGAGACACLWRSVFRDVFKGVELAKYGSYLAVFIMFIVPAAPMLGGYFQDYFGWRASFIFMEIYSIIALILLIMGFKETNIHIHKNKLKLPFIFQMFLRLLKNRIFMSITLCTFLSYGAAFAWFITGPELLIHVVGISPVTFGWITFFGCGLAYAAAGFLNGKFVGRFGISFMLRFGFCIMILSGVLMFFGKFLFGVNIYSIFIPIILFYFGSTFIWPNAFATAFSPFGDIAGYAGALYGFMQVSGASVVSAVLSHLTNTTTQTPLSLVIMIASLLALFTHEFIMPHENNI